MSSFIIFPFVLCSSGPMVVATVTTQWQWRGGGVIQR